MPNVATARLEPTGVASVRLTTAEVAAGVADAVWRHLERRAIRRDDPTTWPGGVLHGLQALRHAGVYRAFGADALRPIADEVLGVDRWSAPHDPQALVTFPTSPPWVLPHAHWHLDFPGRGSTTTPDALRVLGIVEEVRPSGGGTLVVEGSHALIRRMVDEAGGDAGSSTAIRRALARRHRWFRDLFARDRSDERSAAERFFDPTTIDGVQIRVRELTGDPGTGFLLHPWTLHGISPNTTTSVRSMCSGTILRAGNRFYDG